MVVQTTQTTMCREAELTLFVRLLRKCLRTWASCGPSRPFRYLILNDRRFILLHSLCIIAVNDSWLKKHSPAHQSALGFRIHLFSICWQPYTALWALSHSLESKNNLFQGLGDNYRLLYSKSGGSWVGSSPCQVDNARVTTGACWRRAKASPTRWLLKTAHVGCLACSTSNADGLRMHISCAMCQGVV